MVIWVSHAESYHTRSNRTLLARVLLPYSVDITLCIYFFSSITGGFPQQGSRPTCDCISDPRLIPAVSWGHPTYIMRAAARGSAHIRKMRNYTTKDPGLLSHTAPHAHDACPLDLTLRVVRFPAPRTPHTQTTLVSRIDARNQRSPGAL